MTFTWRCKKSIRKVAVQNWNLHFHMLIIFCVKKVHNYYEILRVQNFKNKILI